MHNSKDSALADSIYLYNILANLPGHVYWYTKDGVILGCNDLQAQSLGFESAMQVVGKNIKDFTPKEIIEPILKVNEKVFVGRSLTIEEIAMYNGKLSTMLSHKFPLKNKLGEIIGLLGISFDINERKILEQELLIAKNQTESTLNTVLSNFYGNVYWYNKEQILQGCNQLQAEALGFEKAKDILGLTPDQLLPKEDAEKVKQNNNKVIKTKRSIVFEEKALIKDKEKYFLSTKAPMFDEHHEVNGILGISLDITKQKKLEQSLKRAREKALKTVELQKEMLRQKDDFARIAAQVAHDIRSPLSAIETFVQLTEKKLEEPERLLLRNAFARIDEIAQNLVVRYKKADQNEENGNAQQPLMVAIIVFEMLAEKSMEYKKRNIKFQHDISEDAYFAVTVGEKREFRRMLSNLINNAVNAMPEGGKVQVGITQQNNGLKVEIVDEGIGMPEKRIAELLSENPSIGTKIGLGLAHAKTYIKNVEGEINIQSALGRGSAVQLSLPCGELPDWLIDKIELIPDATLAVIDDDPTIHDVWNSKLEHCNVKELRHFYSSADFYAWYTSCDKKKLMLLCDYEFMEEQATGVDILTTANEAAKRILVTSHYDSLAIIEKCKAQNLKLLPKHLVPYIKIVEYAEVKPVLIFIDDTPYNTEMWKNLAKFKNIEIVTFSHPQEFLDVADQYPKKLPVYIDQDLGEEKTGVEWAKEIFELGFTEIYLATGYVDFDNSDLPWIKEIRTKKPPFIENS